MPATFSRSSSAGTSRSNVNAPDSTSVSGSGSSSRNARPNRFHVKLKELGVQVVVYDEDGLGCCGDNFFQVSIKCKCITCFVCALRRRLRKGDFKFCD